VDAGDDGDYTLTGDDVGHRVRVYVTASNSAGSATSSSYATQVVGAPVVVSRPVVSGVSSVGSVLSASQGQWSGDPSGFGFSWRRCDAAGSGCVAIGSVDAGDDGDYTLTGDDVGHRVRVYVTASNSAGSATSSSYATKAVTPPPDPVIAAAGDIACAPDDPDFNDGAGTATACRQRDTAALLLGSGLSGIVTLGDNQYENGEFANFQTVFDSTWGAASRLIRASAGNREYNTSSASGYFDYFDGEDIFTGPAGDRDKGYYSYDIGKWHLIALNSNCWAVGGCSAGSAQEQWLRTDLAAHGNACTLAYWHHPRFTSGQTGNSTVVAPLFQALYDYGADVVLSGHDHDYERFAAQAPDGTADAARGIREFVVGTGGESHHPFTFSPLRNEQVRNDSTFGVLNLTLHPTSYDWKFRPIAGQTFTDSGSDSCH
jgi:hypothetical protein